MTPTDSKPAGRGQQESAVPLPPLDSLSQQQVEGRHCVRLDCGIALAAGHVVDLGPRPFPGGCGDWFPRECDRHTREGT